MLNNYNFNQSCGRILLTAAGAIFFLTLFLTPGAADDTLSPKADPSKNSKIHVTADSLTTDNDARFAEFSGNVKATQGESVIRADSLKIYYRPAGEAKNDTGEPNAASIEKIIASGNVVITIDDKVAVTQKAVYIMENRVLVLSGKNSKITSGKDSISGETITFYRADGRIKVESGSNRQVEAVFFSGGKGLQ